MGNCHEADTDLTGMHMEEKQIVFVVYGMNPNDKKKPYLKHAFKSLDDARKFASQFKGAYIHECNLGYESAGKFYAGDDPL